MHLLVAAFAVALATLFATLAVQSPDAGGSPAAAPISTWFGRSEYYSTVDHIVNKITEMELKKTASPIQASSMLGGPIPSVTASLLFLLLATVAGYQALCLATVAQSEKID